MVAFCEASRLALEVLLPLPLLLLLQLVPPLVRVVAWRMVAAAGHLHAHPMRHETCKRCCRAKALSRSRFACVDAHAACACAPVAFKCAELN
jgi:hypothetical protein